jgi:hypothetical protein
MSVFRDAYFIKLSLLDSDKHKRCERTTLLYYKYFHVFLIKQLIMCNLY